MILSIFSGINLIDLGFVFLWCFGASLGVTGGLIALVSSGVISNNITSVLWVILAGWIAAVLGDILAYELARKFSLSLSRVLKKFKFYKNNEEKSRSFLKKYEFSFVFFSRFALTAFCAPVSYISGLEKLSRKKFFLAVISGEFLYATIYPILGYIFKETWVDLLSFIQNFFILLILLLVAVVLILKRKKL